MTKKLTVKAAKFSKSAEEAITAKGGSVKYLSEVDVFLKLLKTHLKSNRYGLHSVHDFYHLSSPYRYNHNGSGLMPKPY